MRQRSNSAIHFPAETRLSDHLHPGRLAAVEISSSKMTAAIDRAVMAGNVSDEQRPALTALRAKVETVEEIAGRRGWLCKYNYQADPPRVIRC